MPNVSDRDRKFIIDCSYSDARSIESISIIHGVDTLEKELQRLFDINILHDSEDFEIYELVIPNDIDYKITTTTKVLITRSNK